MKKTTLLKTVLLIALIAISTKMWSQTDVTYTFAGQFADATVVTSGPIDANLDYLADKGLTSNKPTYYTSGLALRMYAYTTSGAGNSYTISTKNGVKITALEIYAQSTSYTPPVKYNIDGGSDISGTWSGTTLTITGINATTSLKFRNAIIGATSTQLRITGYKVTYVNATTASIPTFNPIAGTYTASQTVTISNGSGTDKIYYTTDGSDPSSTSTLYTAPITVASSQTVKAIAYDLNDANPSAIATAAYTINIMPSINVVEASVPTLSTIVNGSTTSTINVSGSNLTGDISIALIGTNADQFSISQPSITQIGGTASNTVITITYHPNVAGTHTAQLLMTSPGASNVTRDLTGLAIAKPNIFISEVYGGGGNSGADLKNDFIELYNNSSTGIDITGWSIQYYAAATIGQASIVNTFELPAGSIIPANSHFLIKCASGTGGTVELPTPDATTPTDYALGASAGKIILYNTNVRQTISDIVSILSNPNFIDYVPYGTTAVPIFGSAMSTAPSATLSATRKSSGSSSGIKSSNKVISATTYVYTGNIGSDFEAVTPTPTPKQTTPTGLFTTYDNLKLYTSNGKILFNAAAGETMEIFNVAGQKVASNLTTDGLNTVLVSVKGVLIVKVANRVGKVIL